MEETPSNAEVSPNIVGLLKKSEDKIAVLLSELLDDTLSDDHWNIVHERASALVQQHGDRTGTLASSPLTTENQQVLNRHKALHSLYSSKIRHAALKRMDRKNRKDVLGTRMLDVGKRGAKEEKRHQIRSGLEGMKRLVQEAKYNVDVAGQTLDEDADTEESTIGELNTYKAELSWAGSLVDRLKQEDALDFMYVGGGFTFFSSVVLYILLKRLRILGIFISLLTFGMVDVSRNKEILIERGAVIADSVVPQVDGETAFVSWDADLRVGGEDIVVEVLADGTSGGIMLVDAYEENEQRMEAQVRRSFHSSEQGVKRSSASLSSSLSRSEHIETADADDDLSHSHDIASDVSTSCNEEEVVENSAESGNPADGNADDDDDLSHSHGIASDESTSLVGEEVESGVEREMPADENADAGDELSHSHHVASDDSALLNEEEVKSREKPAADNAGMSERAARTLEKIRAARRREKDEGEGNAEYEGT